MSFLGKLAMVLVTALLRGIAFCWRVLDRVVGDVMWPDGSRLRTAVHALINIDRTIATGTVALRSEGLAGLLNVMKDRWEHGTASTSPAATPVVVEPIHAVSPLDVPLTVDDAPFEIRSPRPIVDAPVGVSVVIPVLNGSHDLLKLLPTLRAQKGFRELEIIIVDSGSTDDTLTIGLEYGVKFVTIPANEFSHSGARNLGASKATQSILLFMTVDALPPSDTWLHELYEFQSSRKLAAVSCREVPRIDADLFARVENWQHFNVLLNLSSENVVLSMPDSRDPMTLRRSAQLSNVACLIPRELFLKYEFRGEYAEDLDLGLRLIQDGHHLGLMSKTVVIHSHRRSPSYYLRRGYIDKIALAHILGEPADAPHATLDDIALDAFRVLEVLSSLTSYLAHDAVFPLRTDEFCRLVKERLAIASLAATSTGSTIRHHPFLDPPACVFLEALPNPHVPGDSRKVPDVFLPGIGAFHSIADRYLKHTYDVVDITVSNDYQALTYAYLMNQVGRAIGALTLRDGPSANAMMRSVEEAVRHVGSS